MLGIGPTGTIRVGLICRDDALALHNRIGSNKEYLQPHETNSSEF
jgi:hypothetical protein